MLELPNKNILIFPLHFLMAPKCFRHKSHFVVENLTLWNTSAKMLLQTVSYQTRAYARGGVGVNPPPLNLLSYKNVITYAKEFVYVFVHFLLV